MDRRSLLTLLAASTLACRAPATVATPSSSPGEQQAPSSRFNIAYRIAMPDPASHLFQVQIDVGNLTGDDVRLQMPVWSPGRYARFDFARTVQDLTISGTGGAPMRWERDNGSLWRVHLAGSRSITVRYRLFANTLSGTFSVLDTAQYYGQVALYRAGVLPRAGFYSMVASAIVRPNLTAPGRKEVSARMASFEAPFWDGAQPGFAVNRNSFFSYYTKGAGLALYLDLLIRSRTNNARSLDDAFRNLRRLSWEQPNASYYLQGRGYTEEDVERAASQAAGTDLHDWFTTHVGGTADPDYDTALGGAGLRLVRADNAWSIEELANASPAQLKVRTGWITGKPN